MKKARLVFRKLTFLGKPASSGHCEMSSAELFFSLTSAHAQIILNSPDYKKTNPSLRVLTDSIADYKQEYR